MAVSVMTPQTAVEFGGKKRESPEGEKRLTMITRRKTVSATLIVAALILSSASLLSLEAGTGNITIIDPPEHGFFTRRLDYEGIAIKAPSNVVDQALFSARERLSMMLCNLPEVRARLCAAGVELHIIGRNQVTTDLPEWRHDKGKPIAEYHGLTRDQRTRGMGGLLVSCGEENLLKLNEDRYRGRDICVHEFAHAILDYGVSSGVKLKVRAQRVRSLSKGLWVQSYAGSNDEEYFAELTMWYFGTHGDLGMEGRKPDDGPAGLKRYDPEAFALLDDFYSARMKPIMPAVPAGVVSALVETNNLAPLATPSTSFVSGHEKLEAINDGFEPEAVNDHSHGCYGNWPKAGTQWVQYEWSRPVSTAKSEVYWWDDSQGVRLPKACRLLAWDGKAFMPVVDVGVAAGRYNTATFKEVLTTKLRLEFDGREKFSTGIIEWKVYDTGKTAKFPPRVSAGTDCAVLLAGQAHLRGTTTGGQVAWSMESGPGRVTFADVRAAATTARFSRTGTYVLRFTATDDKLSASATVRVTVEPLPPGEPLQYVEPTSFTLTSPFWRERIKAEIVNWIPHCATKLSDPKLPEGGMENFVQAGNKLAGKPYKKNLGAPWSNAYVYNTLESMCLALMVDAQGDAEILAAQAGMRQTLEDWIPKILAAQEPDGYIHTCYTLGGQKHWAHKHDHEGYNAGYLIEAALAHYLMTGGKDTRLYDAARKLADCWDNNLGPAPKQAWYDGHEEMEQALIRLAWFVNRHEGAGKGGKYARLAKFLCDSRRNGEEYDQSHLPVVEQTEAVGHAVRAAYLYSGMAGVAMETGDAGYQSAVKSIWNNLVNRKYYVTGGVGSGETPEGFGKDYSLGHKAYCESCSSCGMLMFQHKLQMTYHDARYADLMEETLYNAILGSVDLPGRNFTYTNPLDSSGARYPWHGCPCCVGNIPRTLLMLPTWTYSTGADSIHVNLFIGSRVTLGDVELVQTTDYPWSGNVAITVNPVRARRLALKLRVPDYSVSELYTGKPASGGITSLKVNGKLVKPVIEKGYAVVERTWKGGDKVELIIPLVVQRVKAVDQIVATHGRVALRYGPLVYNIESVDQNVESVLKPDAPLTTEWKPELLGGVLVIKGAFADGNPMLAIPNYARLNRGGRSIVWISEQ